MKEYRVEVIAGKEGCKYIAIMGTAHSERERDCLIRKAVMAGFDWFEVHEY